VDTETRSVEIVPNSNPKHGHGHGSGACRALKQADLPAFDAVVCHSMGRRALATLLDEGLEVFVTRKSKVEEIVEEVKAGEINRLSSLDACEGRGEGHGLGHGQCHGQGHRGGHRRRARS
jgi:predicted Fe-Mo cluster-binding NifX family protein